MEFERGERPQPDRARSAGSPIHPDFRGRRLADEAAREFQRHLLLDLGFHRLQLEIYGFNERAMRHAERVGFVREGVKRKAYRRHGEWVDGVTLRARSGRISACRRRVDLLYEYVARCNEGVRTGDWEQLGECFAGDAVLDLRGRRRSVRRAATRSSPPTASARPATSCGSSRPRKPPASATARYAWAGDPGREAGTLALRPADGLIAALTVRVG